MAETRNNNGENYPPRSINSILSGILRHMRTENPEYPNFLSGQDPEYQPFKTALDSIYIKLTTDGVGAESSHTQSIAPDEKNQLWSTGVLNVETPKGLLKAVFFYNGKCFCLRGGIEHRNLGLSQLQRFSNPDRYVYKEYALKNRPGGVVQLKMDHKSVTIVANPAAGHHCHVFLLNKYISTLPLDAVKKDLFYCCALDVVPKEENAPWYVAVAVGKNVLMKLVLLGTNPTIAFVLLEPLHFLMPVSRKE